MTERNTGAPGAAEGRELPGSTDGDDPDATDARTAEETKDSGGGKVALGIFVGIILGELILDNLALGLLLGLLVGGAGTATSRRRAAPGDD